MDFSKRTHYYNTHKAHLLLHVSEASNNQQAMNDKLIDAYFKRGLNISDTQALIDLSSEIGLDRDQVEQALLSIEHTTQLEPKKQRVERLKLISVPAIIFNDNRVVASPNAVKYYEQVIINLTQLTA